MVIGVPMASPKDVAALPCDTATSTRPILFTYQKPVPRGRSAKVFAWSSVWSATTSFAPGDIAWPGTPVMEFP